MHLEESGCANSEGSFDKLNEAMWSCDCNSENGTCGACSNDSCKISVSL